MMTSSLALLLLLLFPPATATAADSPSHVPAFCFAHPGIHLPADYDPSVPPNGFAVNDPHNETGADHVFEVVSHNVLTEVVEVDDFARTLTMPVVTNKYWIDPRIKVNVTYTEMSETFFRTCLWSPSFMYLNLNEIKNWELTKKPHKFGIHRNRNYRLGGDVLDFGSGRADDNAGEAPADDYGDDGFATALVTEMNYYMVSVSCVMEFGWYPFDKQTCNVLEMSYDLSVNRSQLTGRYMNQGRIQRELQYELEVSQAAPMPQGSAFFGYNWPTMGWTVRMRRRLGVHLMGTYLPTSLFAVASWISFLIPPEVVPGRMALLVTLLLVQVNIFVKVKDQTPASSRLSAIIAWNLGCIFKVMACMIQYGYLLHVERRERRKISALKKKKKGGRNCCEEAEEAVGRLRTRLADVDRRCLVAFPAVGVVLTLFYWGYHMKQYIEDFDRGH